MDRKWWTLTTVCVGTFMLLLDVTIVNVALPNIQSDFGASLSDLQWVIDAYALTLAALLLTAGSLGDLFGRRRLYAAGVVMFVLGSALCGSATGTLFLTVSRAVQGIGGAVMFATGLALLGSAFQGRERGTAFGVFGAVTGVAVAVGPVLGGVITSGLGWRWIFFVNVPIGAVAVMITLLKVAESRDPRASRPDWAGFLVFSAALGALVYGLIRTNEHGWTEGVVLSCFIAAVVLLLGFVALERRKAHPMLDLSLFRKPTFVGGLFAAFAISASLFSLLAYLVLWFQNELGYSALGTGLRLLLLSGAIFFTAALAGRLSSSVPVRWLIAPGFLLVGVGLLLMRGINAETTWTHMIPGFIVAGIGAGFINVPLASTAVGVVEQARGGMASGINSTFRQVGIATGIAVLGSLFSSHLRSVAMDQLAGTPAAATGGPLITALSHGAGPEVLAGLPAEQRDQILNAAQIGFGAGLNLILLIGGVLALSAALACSFLIRQRDFVSAGHPQPPAAADDRRAAEPATV